MNNRHLRCGTTLPLYLLAFLSAGFFVACNGPSRKATNAQVDSAATISAHDTVKLIDNTDTTDDEHAILYLVIADTGQNYPFLDAKMYELSKALKWPVDTMNRHHDPAKQKIVLAENDEDEMYRGEYFPRRYPSTTLSLEYYRNYAEPSTETNMALVAGIFDQKTSADSMQRILKPYAANAHVVRSKVYMGCMH